MRGGEKQANQGWYLFALSWKELKLVSFRWLWIVIQTTQWPSPSRSQHTATERAECALCIARWTTGKNAYYLLPKEKEIHFTAHIAPISFWDQFSCCMIVINVVAVCNLLPQITDMNDIPAFRPFPPLLLSFFTHSGFFKMRRANGKQSRENKDTGVFWPSRPKTTGTVTLSKCFSSFLCPIVANGNLRKSCCFATSLWWKVGISPLVSSDGSATDTAAYLAVIWSYIEI